MMRRLLWIAFFVVLASSCDSHSTFQGTENPMYISSPAFENGKPIPAKFSCQGENVSPLLAWSGIPSRAKSLALITEDPDAPSGTFYHWVIYNLQPSLTGLPEKVPTTGEVAGIGTQGPSSFGRIGYGGPCPPPGKAHRYIFTLYATDLDPTLPPGLNAAGLQKKIQGHVLAQGQWMGTYQR
jgi:Raf kinase inhibitor-like YbhB/YbcL family protein